MSTIYVNDNFGQWRSDMNKLLDYCVRPESPGKSFIEQIQPGKNDYFVLKPMHSGFYQTPLEVLLRYLDASTLALCGLTTNSCIVCTAHDAKCGNSDFLCRPIAQPREQQRSIGRPSSTSE
jgi:nicotinamidase-related amidase